jgi:hypothetical protein
MTKMTITEALAEIKLINSKLEKKRVRVLDNLVRYSHQPDPFAHEAGGSHGYLNAEVQSIAALEENIGKIRAAIMSANLLHTAEVMGKTKTIYEWLVWKRDVANNIKIFFLQVYVKSKERIEYMRKNPHTVGQPSAEVDPELSKVVPSLNYVEFSKKHEEVCDILSKLDGVLSLKNATIVVDVNL